MDLITREDAYARGLKKYYTGTPCKQDHVAERYVSNTACTACQNWKATKRPLTGPRGRNVGWPTQGLVFNVPDILPEEVEAAFRYMEACGWHNVALLAVRNDPKLLEKHTIPLSVAEQGKLHAKLEKDRRIRDALLQENMKP